jgi:hypothetical protein
MAIDPIIKYTQIKIERLLLAGTIITKESPKYLAPMSSGVSPNPSGQNIDKLDVGRGTR